MRTLLAFAALLWAVALSGCKNTIALPTATAADAPRVAQCQTVGNTYNGFLVGDVVVGGMGTGAGTVAAALPSTNMALKTGFLVGSVVAGALTMTGASLTAIESQAFENGKCGEVVGTLPDLPPAPAVAAPAPAPAPALAPPADAGAPHATLPPGTTEFVVSLDPLRSTACQPCYARGQGCSCVGAECGCVP